MIEPTDEMVRAFNLAWTAGRGEMLDRRRAGIAAVIPLIEREMREQIADQLEDQAAHLRGSPFRRGDLSFDMILGIEAAADAVRTETPVTT